MLVPTLGARGDVHRLQTLWPLLDVKAHALALTQGLKARASNSGMVDEHILATVLGGDEAITFGFIEPLYRSCTHNVMILKIN
jgi:hypothetical protein